MLRPAGGQLHPPDIRRPCWMPDGKSGQAPHVRGATVRILLDRKENMPPADVLVIVGIEARVPAVPGQLTVDHRHELFPLVGVLADEDHKRWLGAIGVCRLTPPQTQKSVIAADLREV